MEAKKFNKLLTAAAAIIAFAAVLPFALAARYAVFQGDDFAFCLQAMKAPGSNYYVKSLASALDTYLSFQGTYFTNIMNTMFNPMRSYSYSLLRVELLGCIFLALLSVAFLAYEIDRNYKLNKSNIYIMALLVLPLVSYTEYNEVYLWYVGAMAYLFPIALLTLGISFTFSAKRRNSVLCSIAACILLFCSTGGVLLIGALGACILLILCATEFFDKRSINKYFLTSFIVTFIGDLVNCLAPGNFAKHEMVGSMNISGSVAASFKITAQRLVWLFTNTSFVVFLLLTIILALNIKKQIKNGVFTVAVIGFLMTPVITVFPMVLGYGSASLDNITTRGLFVLDASIIASYEALAFLITVKVSEAVKTKTKMIKAVCAILAIIAVIVVGNIGNSIPVQLTNNLRNGEIQNFGKQYHEIYDMLRDRPGEDVVVIEMPTMCTGTLDPSINAYPTNKKNIEISEYFGNNSICTGYYMYELEHK